MKMISTAIAWTVFFTLTTVSCGYRFVDPSPGGDYVLASVGNRTQEPGLDRMLKEKLNDLGSFNSNGDKSLSIVITRFEEAVSTINSEGKTVRERLKMDLEWKIQGTKSSRAASGKGTVTKTYPYTEDSAALDWNRSAAVGLLVDSAAELILDRIEGLD
jgi:hypothetical protein